MIISFYSYKGGVGRTQLCANIATYFYHRKKKRVLLWDWDFEAPGLHYFFGRKTADIQKNGTLEILENYLINMRKKERVTKEDLTFVTPENITRLKGSDGPGECIDLLTAGNYNQEFSFRANNFDWFEFYSMMDGANYMELLKLDLANLRYDYILIDSRTGIADYSGICNIQLPDINVMVIAPTMQNYDGCKSIIEKIQLSEYLKAKGRKAKILPILSRIDLSGPDYNKWASLFNENFFDLILNLDDKLDKDFLREVFSDVYYKETFLPYTTAISAGENVFTDTQINKTNFNRPYLNIAEFIEEINQNNRIDFYKKIDESTWHEYLDRAVSDNIKRKAAIANVQIGMKQESRDEKIHFLREALKVDPAYEEAFVHLGRYEKIIHDKEIQETTVRKMEAGESPIKARNKYSIWVLYIVTGASMLFALISGFYGYHKSKTPITFANGRDSIVKAIDILNQSDTSFFNTPTIDGSPYFNLIRNQRKPIGVDISKLNQIYDRSKMKQLGLSFILIKATEGGDYKDARFASNWLIAKKSKFIRGAYHYYISKTSGKVQADNFIKTVKLEAGDLPPLIDLRSFSNNTDVTELKTKNIQALLDRINIFYGAKPIVFMSNDLAGTVFKKHDYLKYYWWIDQANQNLPHPNTPFNWPKWSFWHFSTNEPIDGIFTPPNKLNDQIVGIDQFDGSNKELLSMTLKNSSGRNALVKAYDYLNKNDLQPFDSEDSLKTKLPLSFRKSPYPLNRSNKIGSKSVSRHFNWNVELINHSFLRLDKKTYYGKSMQQLMDMLSNQNLVVKSKTTVQIGDIVFFDFQGPAIQACGLVYNYDQEFVYTIEAGDGNGNKKLRIVKRHRDDIRSYARIP